MSEWMAITQWDECRALARPGIVFEIQNADGLSLLTPCTAELPPIPFDWKSPALRFRAVAEPKPDHSAPIPRPRD